MDHHPSTLTFQTSYPLVLLPPKGARCFLPMVEVAPVAITAAADPRLSRSTLFVLLGGLGLATLVMPFWLACGLVLLLVLGLQVRRPETTPADAANVAREQRKQEAMALLPPGDATRGRFDHYLAQQVGAQLQGLLVWREGPHLLPGLGLNRYPDLVLVTESGFLVAVEIDEPWHWNGSERVLSHHAAADAAKMRPMLARGLVIVRLAEQQLAEQATACVQLLQSIVDQLQVAPAPIPDAFYRQLPWPGDRMELYRDPQRCSWPRPHPPSDPHPKLARPGGVPF